MYAILCYDVEKKRVSKVLKAAKKYLRHTQRSVFEGEISEGTLKRLQLELQNILESDKDSALVYLLGGPSAVERHELGRSLNRFDGFV